MVKTTTMLDHFNALLPVKVRWSLAFELCTAFPLKVEPNLPKRSQSDGIQSFNLWAHHLKAELHDNGVDVWRRWWIDGFKMNIWRIIQLLWNINKIIHLINMHVNFELGYISIQWQLSHFYCMGDLIHPPERSQLPYI